MHGIAFATRAFFLGTFFTAPLDYLSVKGDVKMYYYSKKSRNKIIHTSVCGCVGNRIESFGTLPTLQIAFAKGYRLCRRCNTLAKQYEKEQQKIQNYCSQNGMMTRYEKGKFFDPMVILNFVLEQMLANTKL